jgi:hypothetical protein
MTGPTGGGPEGGGPEGGGPSRPTTTRIVVWIALAAIGLFLIGDGLLSILSRSH